MLKKVIAVDLGGTNMRVSLVVNNKIIKYIKENTPKKREDIINQLTGFIDSFMNKSISGIGVASPGPLNNGVIENTPNLNLKNFDLKGHLKRKFKVRVEVENDGNCVALAESRLGCKKKNFLILTLGTGIGGGIIINGELYSGSDGYGGEVGHMILDNEKTFEDLWQSSRNVCKKCFGRKLMIKELLLRKDKNAIKILNDAGFYLGLGIASLINIFDPEVVILSGGMKETKNEFLSKIRVNAKKHILLQKKIPIKWTSLDHPGTLGAALLID